MRTRRACTLKAVSVDGVAGRTEHALAFGGRDAATNDDKVGVEQVDDGDDGRRNGLPCPGHDQRGRRVAGGLQICNVSR